MSLEKYHSVDTLGSDFQNYLTKEFLIFRENFHGTAGYLLTDAYLVLPLHKKCAWWRLEDEVLWGTIQFSSVQLLSHVWLFATPWTTVCQASLSITNSWSPLKCMSIESVMPSNHLILCRPFHLLPSIFPNIKVFSNESAQVAKVLEFQLQHQSLWWTPRTDLL